MPAAASVDLINRCLQRDRAAQEELYRAHAQRLFHMALQYTGDRDEAKDVLQEAFIKVFHSLGSYSGKGSLEGWMGRILSNTAIDYLRKKRQFTFTEVTEQLEDTADDSPVDIRLPLDKMMELVKRLPEQARIVFNLYVLDDMTHREIAERLSISEGTSKSQYSRARTLLKSWIQKA